MTTFLLYYKDIRGILVSAITAAIASGLPATAATATAVTSVQNSVQTAAALNNMSRLTTKVFDAQLLQEGLLKLHHHVGTIQDVPNGLWDLAQVTQIHLSSSLLVPNTS